MPQAAASLGPGSSGVLAISGYARFERFHPAEIYPLRIKPPRRGVAYVLPGLVISEGSGFERGPCGLPGTGRALPGFVLGDRSSLNDRASELLAAGRTSEYPN